MISKLKKHPPDPLQRGICGFIKVPVPELNFIKMILPLTYTSAPPLSQDAACFNHIHLAERGGAGGEYMQETSP